MVHFGSLIILICKTLQITPIPCLPAAALPTDTGGCSNGDPPNLMIGPAADIDFNNFFIDLGGVVFAGWLGTLS